MSSPSVSLESVFRLFLTTPFSSWSSIPSSAEVILSLKKASFLLIGVLLLNAGNCGNSIDELFGHGSELVDTSMPLDISENVVAVEFSVAYGAKKDVREQLRNETVYLFHTSVMVDILSTDTVRLDNSSTDSNTSLLILDTVLSCLSHFPTKEFD